MSAVVVDRALTTEPQNARCPWPGSVAYDASYRDFFRGRDAERSRLVSLVRSFNFVLLHAPSGSGKSSLVSAAVLPALRDDFGYHVLDGARVSPAVRDVDEGDVDSVEIDLTDPSRTNPYEVSALDYLDDMRPHEESFRDFLISQASEVTEEGEYRRTLLVLDQFEEILRPCKHYVEQQAAFMESLQIAVDVRPNLHVLFIVRDDYLGPILRLGRELRDGFTGQMFLDRITADGARKLLIESAQKAAKVFAATEVQPDGTLGRDVLSEIVEEASRDRFNPARAESRWRPFGDRSTPDGEMAWSESRFISLVTIQIVAVSLWNESGHDKEISPVHLDAIGGVRGAVERHYVESIRQAASTTHGIRTLRAFFENRLISDTDQRLFVSKEDASQEIGEQALATLIDRSVIRSVPQASGAEFVELCHDTFVEPVRNSNQLDRRARRKRRRAFSLAAWAVASLVLIVAIVLSTRTDQGILIGANPISGSLSEETTHATYEFGAAEGSVMTISIEGVDGFDGILQVTDTNDDLLGWLDLHFDSDVFLQHLTVQAADAGTFSVRVESFGCSACGFDISVRETEPQSLEREAAVVGRINDPGGHDTYAITVSEDEEVVVTMIPSAGLDAMLSVVGPSGAESVTTTQDGPVANQLETLTFFAPLAGRYVVIASAYGSSQGDYELLTGDLANAASLITPVDNIDFGEIPVGASVGELVTFTAASGLNLLPPDTAPRGLSFDPTCEQKASDFTCQIVVEYTPTEPGELIDEVILLPMTAGGEVFGTWPIEVRARSVAFPELQADRAEMAFGARPLDEESRQSLRIRNTSDRAVLVTRIMIVDSPRADFAVERPITCQGAILGPDETCLVDISFVPRNSDDPAQARLLVTYEDQAFVVFDQGAFASPPPPGESETPLQGQGAPPRPRPAASSIDFGVIRNRPTVGTVSISIADDFEYTGLSFGTDDAHFSVINQPECSGQDSCVVEIEFGPGDVEEATDASGTLWVSYTALDGTARTSPMDLVSLTGRLAGPAATVRTDEIRDISVGDGPVTVESAHGSIWVTSLTGDSVWRIDPNEPLSAVEVSLETPLSGPDGLAASDEGVWVVDRSNQLVHLDPSGVEIERFELEAATSTKVAVGFDTIWVVDVDGDEALQFDPVSATTNRFDVGRQPIDVTVAAGAVWVTNSGSNSVTRIDPVAQTTIEIPVGSAPIGASFDGEFLWVANSGDNTVSRIAVFAVQGDNRRPIDVGRVSVGARPDGLAIGHGAVWISNTGSNTVSRVDLVDFSVESITVGSQPDGVLATELGVWVANFGSGTVSFVPVTLS